MDCGRDPISDGRTTYPSLRVQLSVTKAPPLLTWIVHYLRPNLFYLLEVTYDNADSFSFYYGPLDHSPFQ